LSKYVSVDIGTTSVKVFLLGDDGSVVRGYVDPINTYNIPEVGGVEQSVDEVYSKVFNGIKNVVKGFEDEVLGLTFSGYGYSLTCLDLNFNPVTNVMTYLDARARDEQGLLEEVGYELYRRTGCPPLYIYPIAKILWLKRRDLLGSVRRFSLVKDYVIYRLSRSRLWYVDLSVASTSGLLNTRTLRWDDLALSLVGVDESSLPELVDGAKLLDYISIPELNLYNIALSLGAMDGTLQNLAYSLYSGEAAMNLGSSAALRVLGKDVVVDRDESMRLYHYYVADGYRVTGAIFNNGMSVIEWFKSIVGLKDIQPLPTNYKHTPSCKDGIYILPFALGETLPFRAPYMKFSILGLTISNTLNDVMKALFEGIGFLFKETINALRDNGIEVNEVHCGGGGCLVNELVKTVSEIMCKPIITYQEEISRAASALGALTTLLRALKHFNDLREIKFKTVNESRKTLIKPEEELCKTYNECLKNFHNIIKTLTTIYKTPTPYP